MAWNIEKRRSERVPANLPVNWMKGERTVKVVATDVSGEGMFLHTDEPATPGALMKIEVHLPDGPPLLLFVMARFVGRTIGGAGIGAEIYVASDADRRRWARYYRGLLASSTGVSQTEAVAR